LTKPTLNVCLDLCAKPQDEPSAGLRREVPGSVGDIRRGTREGNGDPRPEVEARGMFGDQRAGQEGIVLRLLRP
jgi:hypothetical protein